jgi:phosphate transport system permease protein
VLANPDDGGPDRSSLELLAGGRIDGYFKGRVTMASPSATTTSRPEQLVLAEALAEQGSIKRGSTGIHHRARRLRPAARGRGPRRGDHGLVLHDARGAGLALPIGVAASIYLEEFAPKNRLTDLIEVNISNLAAVPSIVFGILGLAIFINFAGLPQSAPIVGGLVLTLMTLPTIIIATRASLRAVPPSIRQAALGHRRVQDAEVFHHVLPLAAPGILTGTIIGLAQALGETAPLLLIGMVAFVREYPGRPARGVLRPGLGAAGAGLQLDAAVRPGLCRTGLGRDHRAVVFLIFMNAMAVLLRRRFERRW